MGNDEITASRQAFIQSFWKPYSPPTFPAHETDFPDLGSGSGVIADAPVISETPIVWPLKFNMEDLGGGFWAFWVNYGTVNTVIPQVEDFTAGTWTTIKDDNTVYQRVAAATSSEQPVWLYVRWTDTDANMLENLTLSASQDPRIFAEGGAPPVAATTQDYYLQLGTIYWDASSQATVAQTNRASIQIARAGGPGAPYLTWAAM